MDIKVLLEERYQKYNCAAFVETDPVSIPHLFATKENVEISGFLTATIAWGQRANILKNASKLIRLMDNDPYDFIVNAPEADYAHLKGFVHRTFNSVDLVYFLKSLRNIYQNHGGLEELFTQAYLWKHSIKDALISLYDTFFELPHPQRTQKHLANVSKGSSAKRLNMFLRWMVRNDNKGVDFGIWKGIPLAALYLPLDVHTGNVSRQLGLLQRKQNDWKAVEEVTAALREFDSDDPVKYDFALFGMGVFEKTIN